METLHTAEIQGPYGPLAIPEQVVQQIWHEQKFLTDQLITASGHRLDVLFPGTWNHCEGPDFRNGRLRFGGEPVAGDVEIHFHARDWGGIMVTIQILNLIGWCSMLSFSPVCRRLVRSKALNRTPSFFCRIWKWTWSNIFWIFISPGWNSPGQCR